MSKRTASAKARTLRKVTAQEFETMVKAAVRSLPPEFQRKLENIGVVVRREPLANQKKEAGIGSDEELLGLYEGVPLKERAHNDGNVLPDKITIFRGPILRSYRRRRQIQAAVRRTILHEFAHYFGISDEHMIEEGTY